MLESEAHKPATIQWCWSCVSVSPLKCQLGTGFLQKRREPQHQACPLCWTAWDLAERWSRFLFPSMLLCTKEVGNFLKSGEFAMRDEAMLITLGVHRTRKSRFPVHTGTFTFPSPSNSHYVIAHEHPPSPLHGCLRAQGNSTGTLHFSQRHLR